MSEKSPTTSSEFKEVLKRSVDRAKKAVSRLQRMDMNRRFLSYILEKNGKSYISVGDEIKLIGIAHSDMIIDECIHGRPNGLGETLQDKNGTIKKIHTESLMAFKQNLVLELNNARNLWKSFGKEMTK